MLTFKQFITEEFLIEDLEKGWMSPTGKAHYFNGEDEHARNHPPALLKKIRKANRGKTYNPNTDHGVAAGINAGIKHGYARFGKYKNWDSENIGHYIHFDHKSKTGAKAALHALHSLHPEHGEDIEIEHNPWNSVNFLPRSYTFTSPSKAAAHIQSHIQNHIHEETITELQHPIPQYKTWGIIHPHTGKLISGHEHPTARHHGHLKTLLSRQEPRIPWHHAPEYGVTHFQHGGDNNSGYAFVRGVTNQNKDKVLKAWSELPMHSSGHMLINGSKEGPEIQMRNHVKNADFNERENE